ncbi:BTB/POZ domain-containing protein 8 isoform X1 [Genypterus blacodes]|uniref:BTB/POZ domain-containing protein 8 isoform X1 n=1 Tax=Genypterus blacodes TaxID=154954 RepID=UPI003F7688CE
MIHNEPAREFQTKERKLKKQLKRYLSSALSGDLNRLLQEELETDVCVYAGSSFVRAHRAVLLARAPHVLQGTHKDPNSFHLPEYEISALKEFLRGVYTAEQRMHSQGVILDNEDSVLANGVVLEAASGLGADLLDLYLRGEKCDITIQVAEQVFSCHRAILCARSQYFRAMLSGSWMESSRQCITLQGLGPEEMEVLLQFMYGAIVDLPSQASPSQVMFAADMLGLEGLKDVVEFVLTRDYCCFFPKPIDGVQRTILECLSITQAIGCQNLHILCKRWVTEHFVKTWSERNFSLLSPELHRACLTAVTEALTVQNAVTMLCASEHLIGSLPEVKWAQQVKSLATELQEEILCTVVDNLAKVVHTSAFMDFRSREELTREPTLLKKLCSAIREGVTVHNCCDLFSAVDYLSGGDVEEASPSEQRQPKQEEPFMEEICILHTRLWTFLLQTFYAVRHTQGWETLSSKHRERILAAAIDIGDNRRLGKKPVFTSSQQRAVKCLSSAPENATVHRTERVSEHTGSSSCSAASAMKSDALGAGCKSGDSHTTKTKNVKKPGERSIPPKSKTASTGAPVLNGSGAAGARQDIPTANGPRVSSGVREQEKKPNPGARPKTSPPSYTSASQTVIKAQKGSAGKTDGTAGTTQPHRSASSTSGSLSPENSASNPRNDGHSSPGAKPKQQAKVVNKSPVTKAPLKTDPSKTSSPTKKSSVRESTKAKPGSTEKVSSAVPKADTKGRNTPENHVSRHGNSTKKPTSPRKEDAKQGSKSSAQDKSSEAPKKKITKAIPATAASPKTSAKPPKASSVPSKQSSLVATKPGPKPKSSAELSSEKTSPKSGGSSKTSGAIASKKTGTKGKEVVNGKNADSKTEPASSSSSADVAEHKDGSTPQTQSSSQRDSLSTKQSLRKTQPGKNEVGDKGSFSPLAKPPHHLKSDSGKQTEGSIIPARVIGGQVLEVNSPNSPRDGDCPIDTPCSMGSTGTPGDSWSGMHRQVSPESETGSTHTTSSDDIKPRSEDYDAGGSQDDDCSNDRGVSKCGTMRCHDFLGRSSSDTSTPEELKMYEGGAGLRVEVRVRGRETETTSEEEATKERPRSWLHRDEIPVEEEHSDVEATVTVKSVPDHQLFSSEEEEEDDDDEEETEDERSEVEVVPGQGQVPTTEPSPLFQGIVNLAFDDDAAEQENEQSDFQSTSNFRRSVLLSVDECEELGSEDGGVQTPPQQPDDAATPCDVFECDNTAPQSNSTPADLHNHSPCHPKDTDEECKKHNDEQEEKSILLTKLHKPKQDESSQVAESCSPQLDADTRDLPPQERPCHLDLRHAEQYSNGGTRKNHTSSSDSKKADLHLNLNEPQLTGDSPVHAAQSPAGNV